MPMNPAKSRGRTTGIFISLPLHLFLNYLKLFIHHCRGGYVVVPDMIEFWQGQSTRIHDRIRFRRPVQGSQEPDGILTHQGENGWIYERLAP